MPNWTIKYDDGSHRHLNVVNMQDLCHYLENVLPRREEIVHIEMDESRGE